MNRELPSPVRAHNPKQKHLKLPPHAAAASGISGGVERVTLNFLDTVVDPNLEDYKRKDRSRSTTPPDPTPRGSPWSADETTSAADGESMSFDAEPTMAEVVNGHKGGARCPKPKHANQAREPRAVRAPRRAAPLKEAPAVFDRSKLLEGLGTTEEATVKSAGIVEEVHASLAEYAKTTISADHLEENPALKMLENPLEGVSNDHVTHADVKLFLEAVVRPNPLLQKQTLKDLKLPKNLKKFMKALSILIDTQADMGTSNAFQVSPAGFKNDGGIPVYYYSVALSSQEGKDNLLTYKWKADDLIFKYYVEFRDETLAEVQEISTTDITLLPLASMCNACWRLV